MIENQRPPRLDIKPAALAKRSLSGSSLLLNFERLTQETQGLGHENALNWSAYLQLRADAAGQFVPWLHLTINTVLPLTCQRCLGPVDMAIDIDRWFRFVETEAAAQKQDDASEEDLLVSSREFDLAGLIEDEVLMDLPLVPRHDICPVAVKLAVADADFVETPEKPNPFASLAPLKGQSALPH
ncbi:MAG: DUF177 domain-containing protein [Rhodoferax sp.]|nr:DUF177 domain-containing protein [Rhodoferax sp.]